MQRLRGSKKYRWPAAFVAVAVAVAVPAVLAITSTAGTAAAQRVFSIDHFKCYSAQGKLAQRRVTLRDQFGTDVVTVTKPLSLCAPADKNGEGIQNEVDHLTCYQIKSTTSPNRRVVVDNQFGSQILSVGTGEALCVPSLKSELDQVETDVYCCVVAVLTLTFPTEPAEEITLTGPAKVIVHTDPTGLASDTDGDGLDQVKQELVELDLTGKSSMGPVELTLQAIPALGEIEENVNATPGILDLPPFTPAGSARSFFDIFFLLKVGPRIYHNAPPGGQAFPDPLRVEGGITHKPSAGETYRSSGLAHSLLDENGNPTGIVFGPATFTP